MNNLLKRIMPMADSINLEAGALSPATITAVQNIGKILQNSSEINSFAEEFADHVLDPATTQTSALFSGDHGMNKEDIVKTVINIVMSLIFYAIGKKKFSQLSASDKKNQSENYQGLTVDGGYYGRDSDHQAIQDDEKQSEDTKDYDYESDPIISTVNSAIAEKQFDAFDDGITHLQQFLLSNVKF